MDKMENNIKTNDGFEPNLDVVVNNGAPYSPKPTPIPVNNNEAFYGSVLGGGDIISNYMTIREQYKERGQSAFLEELSFKIKQEEDETNKFYLESVLKDTAIDKSEKLLALKSYVEKSEFSVSLKEKYKQNIIIASIQEDPLPVSDENIENKEIAVAKNEADAAIQDFSDTLTKKNKGTNPEDYGFFERNWQATISGFEQLSDVKAGIEIALSDLPEQQRLMHTAKAEQAAEEMNNIPLLTASDIQRIAKDKGIIPAGLQIPSFILESIVQAGPQMAIPLLTAVGVAAVSGPFAWITGPLAGIATYGVQQFGNFVSTQALVREFAKDMDYKSAGQNALISAPLGFFADKFVTLIKFAPRKPLKDSVFKEVTKRKLGVAVVSKAASKGVARGVLAEGPTEMFEAFLEREQAGLSIDDDEAWDAYWDAGWAGAAAGSGIGGGFGARAKYKEIRDFNNNIDTAKDITDKVNASPTVKIKHNAPVALTLSGNPKLGNDLIVEALTDPTGKKADVIFDNENFPALTVQTLLFYLNNSQDKFFETDTLGYSVDTSVLHENDRLRDLNLMQRYFNEGDRAGVARFTEISDIVSTINQTDVNMIPARTFSYIDPTPTGMHTYLTFRRNSTEDFQTLEETKIAYESLKRSIVANFGEDALTDLSIVEVDNKDTGKLRTINDSNIDAILKNEGIETIQDDDSESQALEYPDGLPTVVRGNFRIVWNKNETLYDAFVGGQDMKATFSDRYPQDRATKMQSATSTVYSFLFESKVKLDDQGNLPRLPTGKDSISPYMAFNNATMHAMYSQDLAKEAFFKSSFERLNQVVKEDLTIKQQLILKNLLFYMNRADIRKNYLSPREINTLGGNGKLTPTAINKLQIALQTYRQVVDELDHARQRVMRADLQQRGFNEQFSFVDDIGTRNILATQSEFGFRIEENFLPRGLEEGTTNPISDTNIDITDKSKTFNVEVYDFVNKNGVLHKADNTSDTKEHYLDDKSRQKIYKLHEVFTDEAGNKFMYGVFGAVKPQPLPKFVSPQMDGYIPTLHAEGHLVKRIKSRFRLNGKQYDFSKDPASALKYAEPFSESVFMVQSEQKAIDLAKSEQRNYINDNSEFEYIYYSTKASEIDGNGVKNDNEIRRYQLKSNKQRTQINYELESDPYSSLIENTKATNQQYLDVVGIGQLKAEFMRAVENNPDIMISKPDEDLGIGRVEDAFPTVDKIKPVKGREGKRAYSHFLRLHNKITLLEHGRQRGMVAGLAIAMADYMDWTAKLMYTDKKGKQKKTSIAISQAATDVRRNAGAVVGSVMKPVTTFWILMRPIKQLLLQSMASLGPIAVISKGNPFIMARIYVNAIKLIGTRISNQKMMREGKGDIQKVLDNMYNEKDLAAMGVVPDGHNPSFNYSKKELEFIDQWMRKSGLSNVQDHVYNHGIGWSNIPELGSLDKSNLNPLSQQGLQNISQGGTGLLNPMMYIGKISALSSKYGFEFGESINRDLFAMVALEDFRQKNPKANWKSDKNMSNIMIEANKLAGGMNNTMAFGWQGNFGARVLGLFTSFSQKMSTRYFDPQATPFTFKQRSALMAADVAIYGTLILSLEETIRNQFLQAEDEDLRKFGELMGRLNFVSLMYNSIGTALTGEESKVEVGKTFGVLGPSPLGPMSTIYKLIAEYIETGAMSPDEHIAALSFYKNLLGNNGAAELLIDSFGGWRGTLTPEQRIALLGGSMKKMIPLLKQTDKLIMGLVYDEWLSESTKSGMNTGLEITTPEKVGEFLGLQNTNTIDFWNQISKNSLGDKEIRQEAKDFIEKLYIANDEKSPDLLELRNMIAVHKFMLDKKYASAGMKEHRQFTDEVFRLIAMQDSTMVDKFANSFRKDHFRTDQQYSSEQLREAQVIAQVLIRKYPDRADEFNRIVQDMIDTNNAYKENN